MNQLPKWILANPFPAIYDFESLTVIDQTACVYGAMTALINEYNKFADTVNDQLSTFTESEQDARQEFELQITKVMNEFRCSVEQYLILNLESTAVSVINAAIANGNITLAYDESSESLNLALTEGE